MEDDSRSNPWLKAIAKNHENQTKGRGLYQRMLEEQGGSGSYDPFRDSGEKFTGYQHKQVDQFSAASQMGSAAEAHNANHLWNSDPLASHVSNYVQANEKGTVLPEDLYGKVNYGEDGRNFLQIGADLTKSVMDQFQDIGDANQYSPSIYASNGMGSDGLFKGWNGGAGDNNRLDQFGNVIKTEGLQDFVEEGGRRFNLDMAGNRTEVNPLTGQPFESAGGLDAYYSTAGYNSNGDGWNNNSMNSFYGVDNNQQANAGNIWGTGDNNNGANIWGHQEDRNQQLAGWGGYDQNNNNSNLWGGSADPNQNNGGGWSGFGSAGDQGQNSGWGGFGGGSDPYQQQQQASNVYGTSPSYSTDDDQRNRGSWFWNNNNA